MSPHHSLELLPQYRRLQEVVTIDLRKELRAQLCALDSLYPQNYRSGISMLMYGRGGRAPVDGSEVSVLLTHTNRLVMVEGCTK